MIKWEPFRYQEKKYNLEHVHPEVWLYVQTAPGKPDIIYQIQIIYTLHTFTKNKEENHPDELDYSDNRETRTFCFDRYEWTHKLPVAIKELNKGYVYHTGRQNFLRIPSIEKEGNEYEIFFTLTRSNLPGIDLNLKIHSAYYRTKGNTPKAGKIRFGIIAYNTKYNRPIKVHRR